MLCFCLLFWVFFFLNPGNIRIVMHSQSWFCVRSRKGTRLGRERGMSRLSSMSSEVGLAVGARMMHVHALVNAARDQTATEPAAKECNQKARNVGDEAG